MPAHVTLLYPFAPLAQLGKEELHRLETALLAFGPVEIVFREAALFSGPQDLVLWLRPEPAEPFVQMTEALIRVFPEHPPYGGIHQDIVPHLGIAHGDEELFARIRTELAPALSLRAQVREAWLFEHARTGWRRERRLSFRARPD